MGVVKFGVKDAVGVEETGGSYYDGEVPPPGPYRGVLKRLELKKTGPNSKTPGTPMLGYLVEIQEPKGSKNAKYNGYGIFGNQMITDQGKGYINLMLNSMAGNAEDGRKLQRLFWEKGVTTDGNGIGHIKKIGTKAINSPECEFKVIFGTKNKKVTREYPDPGLEVTKFMVATDDEAEDAAEAADDEDFDGDDVADDDEDFGDDAEDDGDEDDADDDASDDGDDEDDDSGLDDDDDDESDDDEDLDDEDEATSELQDLAEELSALELKPLRLKARDEYGIAAAETKGKSEADIVDMIIEVAKARTEDDPDLDDEADEPVKPVRKKSGKAPF